MAQAQLALADGKYPDACAGFRLVTALDTTDVGGLYGAGECQSRDSAVVPDPRSPSGFSFRGSMERAIRAYVKIVEDRTSPAPAFVYRRLSQVLYPEGFRYRPGKSIAGPRRLFGAYPALQSDTLAFVPYPMERLAAGGPDIVARGKPDAIEHNRALLRRLYLSWLRGAPNSVDARIAMATLLETTEQIKSEDPSGISALNQIQQAIALSTDSTQRLKLARSRARLLVKSAEWSSVAAFADSLFRAVAHPATDTSAALVGIAALTGRIRTTADILRTRAYSGDFQFSLPDGTPLELKPAVQEDVQAMFAFAALGACTDSLRGLPNRMDRVLASYVATARRRAIRDAVLGNVLQLAVPCVGAAAMKGIEPGGDQIIAMEQALARSDYPGVRTLFARIQAGRSADRPGDVAIEYTYIESWLLAQSGDTATAIAHLDPSLNALPTLGRYLLDRPSQSAGLVRAMGLRAELGAATGDRVAAKRWGTAVATLWAHADPELQPYVTRMRALAVSSQ
jgi:hypothetical protein